MQQQRTLTIGMKRDRARGTAVATLHLTPGLLRSIGCTSTAVVRRDNGYLVIAARGVGRRYAILRRRGHAHAGLRLSGAPLGELQPGQRVELSVRDGALIVVPAAGKP